MILAFLSRRMQVLFSVGSILIPTPSICFQGNTERSDIIRVLQPLAAKRSLFTVATNRIMHTCIATIIVLEYSAFLPVKNWNKLKSIESAVEYYLESPTVIAVEKGAKDISRQGYGGEELEKKIFEFILENRMSKDLAANK
ncbi:uncharacterized protein EDB93DRAFT_1252718 [Suillus bovinus]|uniref:uncharacterized protein n=1 Tax=Suillus bovinus TaxID=48563 RepID=UPI001B88291E|nr:uncharacterized protein EDB93DRAFT_1252718 [Suillus bovinus]KAG2140939.1 hypothetical protein EDB93DRAFT_1252718 [Suillus bovinus]